MAAKLMIGSIFLVSFVYCFCTSNPMALTWLLALTLVLLSPG
jgi:hypothetical protein